MAQHVIDRAMQVHGGEGIDGVSLAFFKASAAADTRTRLYLWPTCGL